MGGFTLIDTDIRFMYHTRKTLYTWEERGNCHQQACVPGPRWISRSKGAFLFHLVTESSTWQAYSSSEVTWWLEKVTALRSECGATGYCVFVVQIKAVFQYLHPLHWVRKYIRKHLMVNPSASQISTCYACLSKRWQLEFVYKRFGWTAFVRL